MEEEEEAEGGTHASLQGRRKGSLTGEGVGVAWGGGRGGQRTAAAATPFSGKQKADPSWGGEIKIAARGGVWRAWRSRFSYCNRAG